MILHCKNCYTSWNLCSKMSKMWSILLRDTVEFTPWFQLITLSSIRNSIHIELDFSSTHLLPNHSVMYRKFHLGSLLLTLKVIHLPQSNAVIAYINCAEMAEVNQFYEDLRQVTKDTPRHNVLVVIGDLNAKIGKEDAQFTYNKVTKKW